MSKNFLFIDDASNGYQSEAEAYLVTDYINASTGASDAGKPIVLNSEGKVDSSMIPFGAFDWKESVRAASTANVPLTGGATLSIDGVALANDDRILLKDQTDASENGIYVVSGIGGTYALTRSEDADADAEVTAGFTTIVTEGSTQSDKIYVLTSIDISNYVVSVDLLDSDSGLEFAGGSNDELAIDWASTFTIDGADDLAFKASDLASTSNGAGASIVGIEDASSYYTGTDLETVLNEIEAQLGGDTSATFNFTEDNVLADNDAVYAALDKLDLKWGDLASNNNAEGASLVGIEDAAGNFDATDVEGALTELYNEIVQDGVEYTVGTGGVTKGDLVYISGNDTVNSYDDITVAQLCVGIALTTQNAGETVKVLANDTIIEGILSGATAGTRYFWDGTNGWVTNLSTFSAGDYIYAGGVARNSTDAHCEVMFIKKQS